MYTYEVKFIYKDLPEELRISTPFFNDLRIENTSASKARNDAFQTLQSILKKWIDEKKILFKDPDKDIYHMFDTERLKKENGEYNLAEIYRYPMFLSDWLRKISLFWNGKEIYRIGNITSAEEYEIILNNAREEFLCNHLNQQNNFGFHLVPFQDFYTFRRILIDMKFNEERSLSWDEWEELMKII